jgi:hypothetical protein
LRRSTSPDFSDTSILRGIRRCCAGIPLAPLECMSYYPFPRSVSVSNDLDIEPSPPYFNPPSRVPFSKLILVDPPIWSKAKDGQEYDVYKMVEEMTPLRRDILKSSDDAKAWRKSRIPWGAWNERVFEVHVVSSSTIFMSWTPVSFNQKYGLRALSQQLSTLTRRRGTL